MKFFRCSRLVWFVGGATLLVVLNFYSPVLRVSRLDLIAISDESSYARETKPSVPKGNGTLRKADVNGITGATRTSISSLGQSTTVNTLALENIFISVKTTPKYYESRIRIIKKTWFQVAKKDKLSIVSDFMDDNHNVRLFETELIKEGFQVTLANCSVAHERGSLCCKSGTEYMQFYAYLESHQKDKHQLKWFCHFDDDVYVNIKELFKLLLKYDSSKAYYIGRSPRGKQNFLNKSAFKRVKEHFGAKENVYLYSAGAAYCISLPLMIELKDYFNGVKRFTRTCNITGTTDDLTVGIIIDMVLGHELINTETMYTQSVYLRHLSVKNLTKLITFGYGTDTKNKIHYIIDPKPRLNLDPTRFLTYHCLLYNETSWCLDNQPH